jgi:hypothetical protein
MVLVRTGKADVIGNAVGQLFLLVFLLYSPCSRSFWNVRASFELHTADRYPMLTNKIFDVFLCRYLGPNTSPASVLHADYTVDCDATATQRYLGGGILVLVWSIGLPAGLFYAMYKRRTKILAGDEATLRKFAFVLGDYKSSHWYWEVSC